MELFSVKNIKEIFKQKQIKPLKKFGQNFLINKGILEKFIKAVDLNSSDIVLEIGPGLGTLTQELAQKAKQVIAIEKDRNMVAILKENLKNFNNVKIIEKDILKEVKEPENRNYKVVGNLPFYLTAPIIRKFLELKNPPKEMVLMVQKEVAQRICNTPPRMSILSVSIQLYAETEIVSFVSKKNFWPQPKVDSGIIKITPSQSYSETFSQQFFQVVKAGFSQPRKQLINNLSKMLKLNKGKTEEWLSENNIDSKQRAETLSVKDWINLTKTLPK